MNKKKYTILYLDCDHPPLWLDQFGMSAKAISSGQFSDKFQEIGQGCLYKNAKTILGLKQDNNHEH